MGEQGFPGAPKGRGRRIQSDSDGGQRARRGGHAGRWRPSARAVISHSACANTAAQCFWGGVGRGP
eukprot:296502-Pyramimonas_sp.AAC.1